MLDARGIDGGLCRGTAKQAYMIYDIIVRYITCMQMAIRLPPKGAASPRSRPHRQAHSRAHTRARTAPTDPAWGGQTDASGRALKQANRQAGRQAGWLASTRFGTTHFCLQLHARQERARQLAVQRVGLLGRRGQAVLQHHRAQLRNLHARMVNGRTAAAMSRGPPMMCGAPTKQARPSTKIGARTRADAA